MLLLILFACTEKEPDTRVLYVNDHLEDCVGVAPQKCMLVRESPEQEWSYFYNAIEGFTFEEGNSYKLLVQVTEVKDPPADASSLRYSLVEVLSKEQTSQVDIFDKQWEVYRIDDTGIDESNPSLLFQKESQQVAGFAGCNRFFSSFTVEGNNLKLGVTGLTRMMCQDMTVEDAFVKALEQVRYFEVSGDELHLMDEDGNAIILSRLAAE